MLICMNCLCQDFTLQQCSPEQSLIQSHNEHPLDMGSLRIQCSKVPDWNLSCVVWEREQSQGMACQFLLTWLWRPCHCAQERRLSSAPQACPWLLPVHWLLLGQAHASHLLQATHATKLQLKLKRKLLVAGTGRGRLPSVQ